ncbi:intercellular adhesion molecule 1-like [Numida meleagris]|uniref:intercellular adhesion molecule 1-like n=1 Tax=Numida meleagris TaxID=8996 RepID=UPI000B3D998E|nr:intercellular adhesion molecule 1-like [Numida meleagris]
MDDASCPPTQTWTEGQEATLQCRARGNPVPVVTCHKDGTVVPVGRSHVVTRNYTGTYWCNATNALGTSRRNVTVTVEYRDINVGLVVALVTLAAVAAVTGVVVYRVYYHKKKIRHYKLQEKQQRLLAMGQLTDGATVAQNGSAPAAQP